MLFGHRDNINTPHVCYINDCTRGGWDMKSQASLEKHLRQIHRAATFADNVEARNNGEGKEEEYAAVYSQFEI